MTRYIIIGLTFDSGVLLRLKLKNSNSGSVRNMSVTETAYRILNEEIEVYGVYSTLLNGVPDLRISYEDYGLKESKFKRATGYVDLYNVNNKNTWYNEDSTRIRSDKLGNISSKAKADLHNDALVKYKDEASYLQAVINEVNSERTKTEDAKSKKSISEKSVPLRVKNDDTSYSDLIKNFEREKRLADKDREIREKRELNKKNSRVSFKSLI